MWLIDGSRIDILNYNSKSQEGQALCMADIVVVGHQVFSPVVVPGGICDVWPRDSVFDPHRARENRSIAYSSAIQYLQGGQMLLTVLHAHASVRPLAAVRPLPTRFEQELNICIIHHTSYLALRASVRLEGGPADFRDHQLCSRIAVPFHHLAGSCRCWAAFWS